MTRLLFTIASIAALIAVSEQAIYRRRGNLPTGAPEECCRVFCPPLAICVCCFLDYEYHDGLDVKRVNGVPTWLLEKHNMTIPAGVPQPEVEEFDG